MFGLNWNQILVQYIEFCSLQRTFSPKAMIQPMYYCTHWDIILSIFSETQQKKQRQGRRKRVIGPCWDDDDLLRNHSQMWDSWRNHHKIPDLIVELWVSSFSFSHTDCWVRKHGHRGGLTEHKLQLQRHEGNKSYAQSLSSSEMKFSFAFSVLCRLES